jgi:hypothetical protein
MLSAEDNQNLRAAFILTADYVGIIAEAHPEPSKPSEAYGEFITFPPQPISRGE